MRVASASGTLRVAAVLLASAFAFAGCSTGPAAPTTTEVRMHYSKFLPASLEIAAGTTVDFVLVNEDPVAHEFVIGTEAEHLAHEKGAAGDPHTGTGEASIPAQGTVRLSYTFAKAGTLLYACHVPGHYNYGMKGSLKVI
ncbi:MAG: cupredoxin domain-containing protein [Actinomycetota bacterium]